MFRNLFNKLAFALVIALVPVLSFAQLDVSAATGAIADGQTAVVAIITALLVAYGAFLGLRMALRAVKRG